MNPESLMPSPTRTPARPCASLARLCLVLAVAVAVPALTGCPTNDTTFGPTFDAITGPGTVSGSGADIRSDVALNTAFNYDVTINARTAGQNITLEITRAGGTLTEADSGFTMVPTSSSANDTVTINLTGTTGTTVGTITLAYRATDPDGNVNQVLHQINIFAEPPTKIVITTEPTASNTTAGEFDVFTGESVGNVVAELHTAADNLASEATNAVTIAFGTNPNSSGTLTGTLTKNAVGGVVTFDDLGIDLTALETGFTLTLTATGLTSATTTTFDAVASGPVIFTVTPGCIRPGISVTITGANFNATPANNTVHFTGADATGSSGDATSVTVTAPTGISAGTLTVEDTVAVQTSPTKSYTLCPARVSKDSSGTQGNGASDLPAISSDGRYVAFQSAASNLVTGDTNGNIDIFVKDTETGAIERVNVDDNGTQSTTGDATNPDISSDGRYVVFQSIASDLVTGDTNNRIDIFLHDRDNDTTTRVSVSSTEEESTDDCINARISGDGMFVVFQSTALNLASGKAFTVSDCFLRDIENGTTEIVSLDNSDTAGTQDSYLPDVSNDGTYVAFASDANLTATDTNAGADIYRRDRTNGVTVLVSVEDNEDVLSAGIDIGLGGLTPSTDARPAISSDGMNVLFLSASPDLTAAFGAPSDVVQVFRRNLNTDATTLISRQSSNGTPGNANSRSPSIGGSAQYALFHTNATNLDSSDADDIIHSDMTNLVTTRVNLNGSGTAANGVCDSPMLAGNGRIFAFATDANNLVESETDDNLVRDVIVSSN